MQVNSLTKVYSNISVIDNLTFKVKKNGIFGLLGRNGAGKTTLLGILMGLITPSTGEILIFGEDIEIKKYSILKRLNFQSPYVDLPKKLTVKQNLIFYSRLYGLRNANEFLNNLSLDLKINPLLNKYFGSLSAGQKTRVSICKALLNKPELLLLDEPTASLDPETSIFIRDYLTNYQKKNNSSILLASHNLNEIENMCKEIIILKAGKIMTGGKISELLDNKSKSLETLFLEN
ncbi:MAG: ABC transporter [Rickettsiales bacterium]|nr:ABC transporter [Rickettsiales bacterium]